MVHMNKKTEHRKTPAPKVTMTDVARRAGCSQSTVSVVLNQSPNIRISEETKNRVLQSARELGYKWRDTRRPRSDREQTPHIAIIFDRIGTSPEAAVSIDGVCQTAWAAGYMVTVYQTLDDEELEARTISHVLAQDVGAILYARIMTREVRLPEALRLANVPVVLLNCYAQERVFPTVVPGEAAGGHRATDVLIKAGHRRIAIITGEMWMDASKARLQGYRRALATADIPFDPELVRDGNWQTSAGYENTLALLDLPSPPTGIFCSNDRMAVGCYQALKERGLRIPDDISVVGYDDEEVARHLAPQLTTLILPHREMGTWASEYVTSDIVSEQERNILLKMECVLVERDSVAPPRA